MTVDLKKLTLDELKELRAMKIAELEEIARKRRNYEETHKIEFFVPFGPQQQLLDLFNDPVKKVLLYQGANRGPGKTTLGANIVGACCLGIYPWNNQPTPFGDKPVKVRILCEDWEHHAKGVIIPKLKEWLPVGSYKTRNNNIGIEGFWDFPNGSMIEIMTNSQETRLHEGWNGHLVWADEPTSRDKYVANKRGLIDFGGKFLMTMTATKETWIKDDICDNADKSVGRVTGIDIRANPHLKEADIKDFEAVLTEDEKIARVKGQWLNLIGLVWKEFNPERHIIDPFDVPLDWPVVAMIDWHWDKPHAVSYYAVNPQGMWHLVDETFLNQSAEDLADGIIRNKTGERQWRIEKAFIDPLSKGDLSYEKHLGKSVDSSFNKIAKRLSGQGITLEVATKDKGSGIRNVEQMLKGSNGIPTLYFCRNTVNAISYNGHGEGTVWEIQHWVYRDGDAVKDNDHFCENLYRLSLTGVKYTDPREAKLKAPVEAYNPLTYGLEVTA